MGMILTKLINVQDVKSHVKIMMSKSKIERKNCLMICSSKFELSRRVLHVQMHDNHSEIEKRKIYYDASLTNG